MTWRSPKKTVSGAMQSFDPRCLVDHIGRESKESWDGDWSRRTSFALEKRAERTWLAWEEKVCSDIFGFLA